MSEKPTKFHHKIHKTFTDKAEFNSAVKQMKPKNSCMQEYDMFGHVINLNFNKNGSEFKTPIGGCFSIVIKIVI
jgi:hypothetical protein